MVTIEFERFGELKIDGRIYYSDMMVWWDGEREFVEKGHLIDMKLFTRLIRKKPEMVVIGGGQQGRVKIPDDVRSLAGSSKIKLFWEPSDKAVDIFNAMARTGKKVAALVHTTC